MDEWKEKIEKEYGELNFQPLGWCFLNHKVELPNGLRVSISKTSETANSESDFYSYVGSDNDFQIALMREEDLLHYPPLLGEHNIKDHVSYQELYYFIVNASTIEWKPVDIFVFDETDKDHNPHWSKRFSAIEGYDAEEKIKYVKRVWKDKVRIQKGEKEDE